MLPIMYLKDQDVENGRQLKHMKDLTVHIQVGDYLSRTWGPDTAVYRVIKVTPKTVTMQRCRSIQHVFFVDQRCDNGPEGLAVRWHPVEIDLDEEPIVRRLSKEGTINAGNYRGAGCFYVPMKVNGFAVARFDGRF